MVRSSKPGGMEFVYKGELEKLAGRETRGNGEY